MARTIFYVFRPNEFGNGSPSGRAGERSETERAKSRTENRPGDRVCTDSPQIIWNLQAMPPERSRPFPTLTQERYRAAQGSNELHCTEHVLAARLADRLSEGWFSVQTESHQRAAQGGLCKKTPPLGNPLLSLPGAAKSRRAKCTDFAPDRIWCGGYTVTWYKIEGAGFALSVTATPCQCIKV